MKWIKVKDKIPPYGERVLVAIDDFVCEAYLSGGGKWKRYNSIDFENWMGEVVAWMPMPKWEG
jgi:hypothetical protein